jgi:hypothetical protein
VIERELSMVYVRLAQGWTDGGGAAYAAGDMVDIDAVTLAELEARGVVATADQVAGDGVKDEVKAAAWPGLTTPPPGGDGHGDAWPGLTTPRPDSDGGRTPEKAEKVPSPDGTDNPDGDGDDAWPGLT